MIKTIRNKGLGRLFESGGTAGVQASHAKRLRLQFAALDTAQVIDDMDIPASACFPKKQTQRSLVHFGSWELVVDF